MVKVGDRIRLSSGKGPDREGVVAAVTGSMLRVRWPSEQETTVIPAPGTLTVLASSGDQAPPAVKPERAAPKKTPTSKQSTTSKNTATANRGATKKSTTSKSKNTATAKSDATKKSATSKNTATAKSDASKKTAGAKRSSR